MSSQQATFVCKQCKEVAHYDFNQKINEDEWKSLQDLQLSSNTVVTDPEKILEQSFVFINKNWDKLQNHQLHQNTSPNKRRNLIPSHSNSNKKESRSNRSEHPSNANDFAHVVFTGLRTDLTNHGGSCECTDKSRN
eukprot:208281_1